MGLPSWLRRGKTECVPQAVFPLIKYKCWRDDGTKSCTKANHSCWRRVIDNGTQPFQRGWKIMGKAARAVLMSVPGSREVFDLSEVKGRIDETLDMLTMPPSDRCCRCGVPICGLTVVTSDIDQAFEACKPATLVPAWQCFTERYREKYGSEHKTEIETRATMWQ